LLARKKVASIRLFMEPVWFIFAYGNTHEIELIAVIIHETLQQFKVMTGDRIKIFNMMGCELFIH